MIRLAEGTTKSAECVDYAKAVCRKEKKHLRMDTHEENRIMQHLIEKAGFERYGIIFVADGTGRTAYEYGEEIQYRNLAEEQLNEGHANAEPFDRQLE